MDRWPSEESMMKLSKLTRLQNVVDMYIAD